MAKQFPIVAAVLSAMLVAPAASATRSFPNDLRTELHLSYAPPCALCHELGMTGIGTVTTPFGESMRLRGLRAGDSASLSEALGRMRRDNVDSDGDGVTDLDELAHGTDPNRYGFVSIFDQQEPSYGCTASAGRSSTGALAAIALSAFLLLALRRRKSHRKAAE